MSWPLEPLGTNNLPSLSADIVNTLASFKTTSLSEADKAELARVMQGKI